MGNLMSSRKVVDARADADGNITHVRLDENKKFTSTDKAMGMADRGGISNAHSVRPKNAKPHLRANPDKKKLNNLDDMAGDT